MKQLQQKHSVITGRGATAIYLALLHCASQRKAADGQQHTLLAPANVCYAALYPALYANWSVRLADVSPVDGNLTFDLVKQAFDEHRPDVLLVPHMYGQPVADMHRIQTLCHEQDVILIEDCASAMGGTYVGGPLDGYALGTAGDYAVFSTGYAKVVEVGFGGFLTSESDSLTWAKELERDLPLRSSQTEQTETLFSKVYRTLRSYPDGALDKAIYEVLPTASRSLFLFRLSESEKSSVRDSLDSLDNTVKTRRELLASCEQVWTNARPRNAHTFPYCPGSVPWRFSFFVRPGVHRPLIDACLREGIPISDWYPSIAPMLGDTGSYPGAEENERSILNLPLNAQTRDKTIMQVLSLLSDLQRGEQL
ncbi:MAG: DegT/DnrJ/EryC1/StrS family aminotransferase [Atopobiaceae bacterium]|nr:DegT/DnrJ/EryC1/StrS family aminotransferase [Atopobiaceae bacterium]